MLNWLILRLLAALMLFLALSLAYPSVSDADIDTMVGYMDPDKTISVITHNWGGTSSNVEMIIQTKRADSYALSELEGTWHANILASGDDAPYWERGVATIDTAGNMHADSVDNDGNDYHHDATASITTDGIITISSSAKCHLDSGKTFATCTETWAEDNSIALTILTRQASSYSNSDFLGEWYYHYFLTPGPYWQRGVITTNVDGSWTMNGSNSEGNTITPLSGSGAAADTSTGVLTIPVSGQGNIVCHLDSGRTVAACTQSPDSDSAALMIMIKKTGSFSPDDFTGYWNYSSFASPEPVWDRGRAYCGTGGSTSMYGVNSSGEILANSGLMAITSAGIITMQACPYYPVDREDNYYEAIIDGTNNATAAGQTVMLQSQEFNQSPVLQNNYAIYLRGGYDCYYSLNPNWTIINGSLTLKGSAVTAENLLIR
jgi:hypothetical protein